MKVYLLILLLLSCSTIQTSISKPPNMDDIINEIKSNPEIQDKTKSKIIRTLEESALYNQECFNKNIFIKTLCNLGTRELLIRIRFSTHLNKKFA